MRGASVRRVGIAADRITAGDPCRTRNAPSGLQVPWLSPCRESPTTGSDSASGKLGPVTHEDQDLLLELLAARSSRAGAGKDNLPLGLELLALEVVARDDDFAKVVYPTGGIDADRLSLFRAGGSYDGGIDGLLYDEARTRVTFLQTKHKGGVLDSDTLSEAREWFNRLDKWALPEEADLLNAETRRLLDEAEFDPTVQQVHLLFVTDQEPAMGAKSTAFSDLAELESDKYADRGLNVTCTIWTARELLEEWRKGDSSAKHTELERLSLPLTPERWFLFEEGGSEVLVFSVRGDDLADLYNRKGVGVRLFEENVRAAMATGKINEAIRKTAVSSTEGVNFFYYNNGVTATCTDLVIKDGVAHFSDLQVVNGAQTVSSLGRALKTPKNPKVYVLMRAIVVKDQGSVAAAQITRFQNTQNPIKFSDFFANEPIQAWLEDRFWTLSGQDGFPTMYYEHKRGKKRGASTTGRRKVTMETLAYLRFACLHDAPFTYKHAKDIWSGENKSERFWRAFGLAGKACDAWPVEEVARAGWMIRTLWELKAIQKELSDKMQEAIKAEPEKKDSIAKVYRESLYLGVLARYVVALAHEGMLAKMESGAVPSFEELMKAPKSHEAVNAELIKLARSLLRQEYEEWVGTVANPRLNLPQNDPTWEKLKLRMRQEIASDI